MKIRFLIQNIYTMGGTVRTVSNLANYLAEHAYDVEIISIRRTSQQVKFELNQKIKITVLFDARKEGVASVPWYRRRIQEKRLEIPSTMINKTEDLYANFNRHIDILLMRALKRIKDGVLVTTMPSLNMLSAKYVNKNVICIGQEHKGLNQHSDSIVKMIQETYGDLDGLTILTHQNYDKYCDLIQSNHLKISVLGNGLKMFHIPAPLNNKVIVSAGRYVQTKRFDWLIESFSKVSHRHPDWKVKIFGSGELREKLKEQVLELGLENQVYLCPNTTQMLTELSKASIFACTSEVEGFGMALAEAMSIGLPSVAFDCDGPREIIKQEDGFLVPVGDVEQFAQKLELLMSNKVLRVSMGKKAIKNIDRFSIECIGENFENIIQKLIQEKSKS